MNFRGLFRREQMLRAIEMRTEAHSIVCDFAQFRQTENLVAARVSEDCAVPGHEFMQPAKLADEFVTGTKIKMISVGKNDLRAKLFQRFIA